MEYFPFRPIKVNDRCGGGLRVQPLSRVGFQLAPSTFVMVSGDIVFDIITRDERVCSPDL